MRNHVDVVKVVGGTRQIVVEAGDESPATVDLDRPRQLTERATADESTRALTELEAQLDRSRLVREDTLCRALPDPERCWLVECRPATAKHWNLLTDWTADALRYAA